MCFISSTTDLPERCFCCVLHFFMHFMFLSQSSIYCINFVFWKYNHQKRFFIILLFLICLHKILRWTFSMGLMSYCILTLAMKKDLGASCTTPVRKVSGAQKSASTKLPSREERRLLCRSSSPRSHTRSLTLRFYSVCKPFSPCISMIPSYRPLLL